MPGGERVAESVEDVFGFEVPERLELEPFGDVDGEGADSVFDESKWSLEDGVVGEFCELEYVVIREVHEK